MLEFGLRTATVRFDIALIGLKHTSVRFYRDLHFFLDKRHLTGQVELVVFKLAVQLNLIVQFALDLLQFAEHVTDLVDPRAHARILICIKVLVLFRDARDDF